MRWDKDYRSPNIDDRRDMQVLMGIHAADDMADSILFDHWVALLVRPCFNGFAKTEGAVARLVGIEGGVVSEEFNLESSGVEAPDRRPRHDQPYYEP